MHIPSNESAQCKWYTSPIYGKTSKAFLEDGFNKNSKKFFMRKKKKLRKLANNSQY